MNFCSFRVSSTGTNGTSHSTWLSSGTLEFRYSGHESGYTGGRELRFDADVVAVAPDVLERPFAEPFDELLHSAEPVVLAPAAVGAGQWPQTGP